MTCARRSWLIAATLLLMSMSPALTPAFAAPADEPTAILRFAPADTILTAGDPLALAIVTDDTLELRTVELTVTYDPAVLTSVSGVPGAVYDGVSVWKTFENDVPGTWHGAVVAMGAQYVIHAPGELYVWNCAANGMGVSGVVAVEVRLFDPAGDLITGEIRLDRVRVTVTDENLTGVVPTPGPRPSLQLAPNPFNPRTRLSFSAPATGPARLDVYDLRGRLIDTPWRGDLDHRGAVLDWSPDASAAGTAASGAYLFVLRTADGGLARARGVLLK